MTKEQKLLQIARRYHQTCVESYCRICTGLDRRGNRIPANKKEAKRIKYEHDFELEWIKLVYDEEFKRSEINKAIREYRESL